MAKLYNLARMTTATTGSGTIALGSAVSGYLTFDEAGVQDGDPVSYGIKDGANSEVGTGTYTASGTTLTRTVTKSTNSNTAISLSGTAEVFITARAEDFSVSASDTVAGVVELATSTEVATGTDTTRAVTPKGAADTYVPKVDDLSTLAGFTGTMVWLTEAGREGPFVWDASDLSAKITADPQQGIYIPPTSDTTGASGAWVRQYLRQVNASWFGFSSAAPASANTTALQAAIDILTSGEVFIPAGIYEITQVTLKPGVGLRGENKYSTRLKAGINSAAMLVYIEASQVHYYISVRDLGFDVNGHTGSVAIYLDGGDPDWRVANVTLADLDIRGTDTQEFATGIHISLLADCLIKDVVCTLVTNAFDVDGSADTDLTNCMAQLGSGNGFAVTGNMTGAVDEGCRLTTCSTNGQAVGLNINGQQWGCATGCSFTTCSIGSVFFSGACSEWKFSACEFAPAEGQVGNGVYFTDANSKDILFSSCQFILGLYGAVLGGERISFVGCHFSNNVNNDILVGAAKKCTISANICDSAVTNSIIETTGADYNNINGNVTNGAVVKVGTHSVAANNVVY